MLKKLNHLLFALLLASITLYAADARLNDYPQTKEWLQEADTEGYAAFNIGVIYHKNIKDYDKAIEWYEKAYGMSDKDSAASAASNLGYLYEDLGQLKNAVTWYQRSIEKGDKDAALNLGVLCKNKLNDLPKARKYYEQAYIMGNLGGAHNLAYLYEYLNQQDKALEWFKKAAKGGFTNSINDLGVIYHDKGDNITAGAYFIALIAYGEPKKDILNFLKNDWKLDRQTLQNAYEFQKTLDIPKHYTGGID